MAHELMIRNGGTVEMAYAGALPWHGLGQKLQAGQSIEDWIAAAGMDWRIQRATVRYATSRDGAADASTYRKVDDKVVLFRSDTGADLSIVSDSYKVVQPKAVLEFFRDLTDAAGFTLETAGTLFGGKRFWALASIGSEAIISWGGDTVKRYLMLSTSCDGSMATEGRYTDICVVCNNTLTEARHGAAKVRVTHRSVFDPATAKRELGVEAAQSGFEAAMADFRMLAETEAKPAEVIRNTAELFIPGFAEMDNADAVKAIQKSKPVMAIGRLAIDRTAIGGNQAGRDGTAWGWLNAVTEYVDHHARARSTDNRIASAWFGNGDAVKQAALERALVMADGSVRYVPESGALLDSVLAATAG